MATDTEFEPEQQTESKSLTPFTRLQIRLNSLVLHRLPLWDDVRSFAHWLEVEALAVPDKENRTAVEIKLNSDATVESFRIGRKTLDHQLDRHRRLWQFLNEVDIDMIRLSPRLEKNQIEDVVAFLYFRRRILAARGGRADVPADVANLLKGEGIHIACTNTSIHNRTLAITYSYCTLQFSHLVHWFERKDRKFNDHRTMFHAAPKYAVIIAVLATGPSLTYAFVHGLWYLAMILSLAWLALFGLIYLLFMAVGSVEYDNEEKAYNLENAFARLKDYTARIQADVKRARMVQEKFLPEAGNMPFADRIEWAASFEPADEVGGDYFDVCALDAPPVAILFSDVSGHGMAAAFVTAILKTTFQSWAESKGTLEQLAQRLNSNLCKLTPDGSFAAVFIALLDISTSRVTYANLGHQPEPWHIPADRSKPADTLRHARNLVLGVNEKIELETAGLQAGPGDTLLFVSDGVVENRDAHDNLYGIETFERFLQSQRPLAVRTLIPLIEENMHNFSLGADQSDDRTILAFRIKKGLNTARGLATLR